MEENIEQSSLSPTLEEKVEQIKEKFFSLSEPDQRYHLIIEMGKGLHSLPDLLKTEENRVRGCQSKLYLHSWLDNGKIFFAAEADALISAGLAALLIQVYSDERPETVLKHTPSFLHDLGIFASLSPNRSNGLFQIHLRMRQDAIKFII